MTTQPKLTFFHAPHTRATGVRILLEELQAPHERVSFDAQRGGLDTPKYLAINPMGKVPCLLYGETIITEQPAIYTFLADTYRHHQILSPALDELDRGAFLRWMSFYGSCFEPAITDRAMKREPAKATMSPYGTYETTMSTLREQLSQGPWFLGKRFTALDVLWGSALGWMLGFKMLEGDTAVFQNYVNRVRERPSFREIPAVDDALAAEFAKAAAAKT